MTEPEEHALKAKVDAIDSAVTQLRLQLTVMHRALIRCQARCHVLAEQPKGWKAVWVALKALVVDDEKKREKQLTENKSLVLIDQLPESKLSEEDSKKNG